MPHILPIKQLPPLWAALSALSWLQPGCACEPWVLRPTFFHTECQDGNKSLAQEVHAQASNVYCEHTAQGRLGMALGQDGCCAGGDKM